LKTKKRSELDAYINDCHYNMLKKKAATNEREGIGKNNKNNCLRTN
jgi:hypothetical protein